MIADMREWLQAREAQAPLLLTGREAALRDIVAALMIDRGTAEVLTLPADVPTITIAEIRDLIAATRRTAWSGVRLVVIPRAERLSGPAAQALLKTLEEPTRATRYLLTSVYPRRLPATILSRCQQRWVSARPAAAEEPDAIGKIAQDLEQRLREGGPSAELRGAFMRLRDYYQVTALRGNEKLAREVLLAYTPANKAG
ncbi:MAG TPA: hypothetical protein VJC05_03890 [Candidatus Andersenbacteria bacterium]|nr:MAG: hypothetical protein A2854_01605 [Parcubacteria group bacterium RIFCSPHIGHO2_01_FULL_56_18]HLD26155.1 hypothetical protein [Candidatus Andersenbacteria bacterium]